MIKKFVPLNFHEWHDFIHLPIWLLVKHLTNWKLCCWCLFVTCIGIDFVFTSSTTISTPYAFTSTFSYSTCICCTFARSFALMNGFVYSRWSIWSWMINKWIEACCKAMQNQQKHVNAHVLFRWLISLLLMSHSIVWWFVHIYNKYKNVS